MSKVSVTNGPDTRLRLGTRGSSLARAQSQQIADALEKHHPGLAVELIIVKTSGDAIADRPLHELGGKGLFTRELEQALLRGDIDLAVHSYKDVPVTMPLVQTDELVIAAVPPREDPRDLLIATRSASLAELPSGARIGTGSFRRRAQLLHLRPDLVIEPIRGNIDTRLRKLEAGEFDAIILALAGVRRAGLFDSALMHPLESEQVAAAPGQGALALQCRKIDRLTIERLEPLNDANTAACVEAERTLVRLLSGDCMSPIAAIAQCNERGFTMVAVVGAREGKPPVFRVEAAAADPRTLAHLAFDGLEKLGAVHALHGQ